MTAGDILLDLKSLIGPGGIATDSQLLGWINESYQYMCDQINQTNPDYFTTKTTINIVSGQNEYTMPTDCEKVVMVNANFTGTWRRLTALQDINQIPVLADPSQIFISELDGFYYTVGGKLGILPLPTAGVTGGIALWYVQQPADLATGDTPLFGTRYHHLIKLGAYANYLDLDDQHGPAEQKLQRFEQRVQEMCETIADRQVDVPKQIEVVEGNDLYTDELYGDGWL